MNHVPTKRRRVSGNDIDSMDEEALRRTLAQYSQELEAYDEVEDVVSTHTTSVAAESGGTAATSDHVCAQSYYIIMT